MLDYAVIVTYFAVMIGIGWWGSQKTETSEEFLVAGRRLGYGLYGGTLAAVVLGGASTIGGIKLGYQHGISGFWLVFMLGLGILALSAFFADRLVAMNLTSVPELLLTRYNTASQMTGAVVMIAYDLMVAVTATIAIGTVFSVIADIDRSTAIIIGGSIVVLYSVMGGMWSITMTDIIQLAMMTIGIFFLLLPMSVNAAGGWNRMSLVLPASYFEVDAIGVDTIVTYFLIYFFGILIGQDIWQRVFTAKSGDVARRAGIGAGLYCLAYGVAGAVIGMAAKVIVPDLAVPDDAFATVAQEVLPVGVAGLVISAALAAVMSTASACMLAASTMLGHDVWPNKDGSVQRDRVLTFLVGVITIIISLLVADVVAALTIAYNLLVGGILVPVIGGLIWPRGTAKGALAATLCGSTAVTVGMAIKGAYANEAIYWGLAASLIVYVAISLFFPEPTPADEPTRS